MSKNDPFIAAARETYVVAVADVRATLTGLDAEGLNWRPAAADTNSIAVLTTHMLSSCRDWLCIALDAPRPPRSRREEFLNAFDSEKSALDFLETVSADSLRVLDDATSVDWSYVLPRAGEPGDPTPTRAYALLHAMEHLREHVAHLQLTRQLWDATKA